MLNGPRALAHDRHARRRRENRVSPCPRPVNEQIGDGELAIFRRTTFLQAALRTVGVFHDGGVVDQLTVFLDHHCHDRALAGDKVGPVGGPGDVRSTVNSGMFRGSFLNHSCASVTAASAPEGG